MKTGVAEWAEHSENIAKGCEHDCRYCYARYNSVNRFKRVKKGEWTDVKVKPIEKRFKKRKLKGVIMFPTTHDITPGDVLDRSQIHLRDMLEAGNEVLIVSKPHLLCIERLIVALEEFKNQVMFRFTIGAIDDDILEYWEPNAPDFGERLACLRKAYRAGYRTSVSMEPLLDWENVGVMINIFDLFVTDSIWIGKMRNPRQRVEISNPLDEKMVRKIIKSQSDENVIDLWRKYEGHPTIKWKDSITKIIRR